MRLIKPNNSIPNLFLEIPESTHKAEYERVMDKWEKSGEIIQPSLMRRCAVEFSGGEKQKIAIARALYKDSPFIILDEPTASLDPLAEADIYARFNEIVTDKTAVYISHRLSSCRFCDKIVVFDEGGIIQQGSHDELVNAAGKYCELWHAQAQYYTE